MSSLVYTDLITADYTTGTAVVNALQSEDPDPPTNLVAESIDFGIRFTWTLGEFWLQNGTSELWEYTANTPFASATMIWSGRATSVTIAKNDRTTRYYWVRVRTRGARVSTTEPSGNGLAGTAIVAADLESDFDAGPYTRSNII